MLQLKDIVKDYTTASETVRALKGVNISFRQKEFVSILGPSGCGKTTLLNIIGGLDHYTSGDLTIAGRSTRLYKDRDWDVYRNHRVGFIFQSYNLIPHQTILGNVELALTIAGLSKEERIRKAKIALDRVGLSDKYNKRPNQLSGGQCQRVAIARALVNDPEILLADEPTGALDTVTSKQIMDLIKEISGERLVIMVTHNPEIAEEYSSRIIRLRDGEVVEDTNPFSPEEEEIESAQIVENEKAIEYYEMQEALRTGRAVKPKKEKAKMSFWTAFKLSAKNLISKRGRTTMVGIAGSIGIIGIAMVLAFSAGIKGYVASMQDDMLSGNPIEIAETGFNASAATELMTPEDIPEKDKIADKVYITSTIEKLAEMEKSLESLFSANTITPEYIEYVQAMPKENYEAMLFSYGIDMSLNMYTDFKTTDNAEEQNLSVKRLIDNYSSILGQTDYANYSKYIPYLVPSMKQAPNNSNYILSQYDLLGGGKIAEKPNEIMLVLNPDEEISDLLLAVFGYYTQDEFLEIVDKATEENTFKTGAEYREYYDYNELIGKEFTYYPTDAVFTTTTFGTTTSVSYTSDSANIKEEMKSEGLKLKVVGILTPKDNVSYGCLKAGIYYTEGLTDHILEVNADSEFINYLNSDQSMVDLAPKVFQTPNEDGTVNTITLPAYTILYNYTYSYYPINDDDDENDNTLQKGVGIGYITPTTTSDMMSSMMGGMGGMGGSGSSGSSGSSDLGESLKKSRDTLVRYLGGNSLANHVLIYPKSFTDKNLVTDYLDRWNDIENVKVLSFNDKNIKAEDRISVTYTDTLELIINLINTMIDVVTYGLVAFTSVSLVVSTVMIGIITYVSVVERIKEIGVIRSLGGRKKDVRHLFNAETFIIGLLAGLIGVGFTYLASLIVNLILEPLIGYSSIAALPIHQALLLILLSIGLTCISGLLPASSAAKKDPVIALRTE